MSYIPELFTPFYPETGSKVEVGTTSPAIKTTQRYCRVTEEETARECKINNRTFSEVKFVWTCGCTMKSLLIFTSCLIIGEYTHLKIISIVQCAVEFTTLIDEKVGIISCITARVGI